MAYPDRCSDCGAGLPSTGRCRECGMPHEDETPIFNDRRQAAAAAARGAKANSFR